MLDYSVKPVKTIKSHGYIINSFIENDLNIDWVTVDSFGKEWARFHHFDAQELNLVGDQYFDIITEKDMNKSSYVLDMGCGSGRWTKYVANKVKFIEAIDPSNAVFQASHLLSEFKNVRVSQASVDNIPFEDNSFDFIFSLGVLHHIPDTGMALRKCVDKLKPGGKILVYLYYSLDNRGSMYRLIFNISNVIRKFVSARDQKTKNFFCDMLAIFLYMPFVLLSRLFSKVAFLKMLVPFIPLSYYRNKSFYIIRNDALDRFGTPLERRFSKKEILLMMQHVGLANIRFSDSEPYWHVIGEKV